METGHDLNGARQGGVTALNRQNQLPGGSDRDEKTSRGFRLACIAQIFEMLFSRTWLDTRSVH